MTLDQTIRQYKQNGNTDDPRYKSLKAMLEHGVTDIPFVVIAMTRQEAGEFLDGDDAIFSSQKNPAVNSAQTERFYKMHQEFRRLLPTDNTRDNWRQQYGDNAEREKWAPFAGERPITELIETSVIADYHRKELPDGGYYPRGQTPQFFWPDFRAADKELFDPDPQKRLEAWGRLHKYYNTVLIIDGLSLFHPAIREVLKASPLAWRNSHIAVLILLPGEGSPLSALRTHIRLEIQAEMSVAFTCAELYFDSIYRFNLDRDKALERWLHERPGGMATLIASQQASPDPGNVQRAQATSSATSAIVTGGPL